MLIFFLCYLSHHPDITESPHTGYFENCVLIMILYELNEKGIKGWGDRCHPGEVHHRQVFLRGGWRDRFRRSRHKWSCSSGQLGLLNNSTFLRPHSFVHSIKSIIISPQKFLRPRDTYKKYILQKKLGQNGHSSLQQWSEQSTPLYMGSQPPTRWSTQKYKYEWQRSSSWAIN